MNLRRNQSHGIALPEYVILISVLALALLAGAKAYGYAVARRYHTATTALQGRAAAPPASKPPQRPGLHGKDQGRLGRLCGDDDNHVDVGVWSYDGDWNGGHPLVQGNLCGEGEFSLVEGQGQIDLVNTEHLRVSRGRRLRGGNVQAGGGTYYENDDDRLVLKGKIPGAGVSAIKEEEYTKTVLDLAGYHAELDEADTVETLGVSAPELPVGGGVKVNYDKRTGVLEVEGEGNVDPLKILALAGVALGGAGIAASLLLKGLSVGKKFRLSVGPKSK